MLTACLSSDPAIEVVDARNLASTVLLALVHGNPTLADLAEWDELLFTARMSVTQERSRTVIDLASLHLEEMRTSLLLLRA